MDCKENDLPIVYLLIGNWLIELLFSSNSNFLAEYNFEEANC